MSNGQQIKRGWSRCAADSGWTQEGSPLISNASLLGQWPGVAKYAKGPASAAVSRGNCAATGNDQSRAATSGSISSAICVHPCPTATNRFCSRCSSKSLPARTPISSNTSQMSCCASAPSFRCTRDSQISESSPAVTSTAVISPPRSVRPQT